MPGLSVKVILQDIKKVETEALIVGFFEDVRPLKGLAGQLDWLLCGSLSNLLIKHKLRGSLGDLALLTSRGKVPAKKIFMVGLGPKSSFSPATLRAAVKTAVASVSGTGVSAAAMEFFLTTGMSVEGSVSAVREGLAEGNEGRGLAIVLLAPNAAAFDKLSRLVAA